MVRGFVRKVEPASDVRRLLRETGWSRKTLEGASRQVEEATSNEPATHRTRQIEDRAIFETALARSLA